MKNALKQALDSNNLPKVRELIVEIIRKDSDSASAIETVTEVIETVPGIFDDDNGKSYPSPAKMTPELVEVLVRDLKSNFSLEKFRLLTEVYARQAGNPEYAPKAESAQVSQYSSSETKEETCEAPKTKCSCGKVTGAVIMALGCAAAIVGLCVPVKFLLGLGIGVFMLGTAFVYMNISRR